jgi:hypothetical protein
MKGFKITCKSEKGEEVLLQDVNANKKVFDIVDVKQKPFLTTTYLFKKRSTVKMAFKMLKPEHLKKHVNEKMNELGAFEGADYEIEVLD